MDSANALGREVSLTVPRAADGVDHVQAFGCGRKSVSSPFGANYRFVTTLRASSVRGREVSEILCVSSRMSWKYATGTRCSTLADSGCSFSVPPAVSHGSGARDCRCVAVCVRSHRFQKPGGGTSDDTGRAVVGPAVPADSLRRRFRVGHALHGGVIFTVGVGRYFGQSSPF